MTEDDNQVFNFVRQPYKLDGTPAPRIKITTFTNYDEANLEGDVEIITEFDDLPFYAYTESDSTTLSLISDSIVDTCEDCEH